MVDGKHLTQVGLEKIVFIKAAINLGLSDQLKKAFPSQRIVRPLYISSPELLHPDWVTGFIEGDGSFYVRLIPQPKRVGVTAFLSIALNQRDKFILFKIQQYFKGIGSISWKMSNTVVEWKVLKFSQIISVTLHFHSYPCIGKKHLNLIIWDKVVTLMGKKEHLTPEGLVKIKTLVGELNK